MYSQASKKLMDTIEDIGHIDIFPVTGWEQFLDSKSDLVSIPHKITFDCEKKRANKLLRMVYKRYPILVLDEHPNAGVRNIKGTIYTRLQMFSFMLSSYGGSTSIEKLELVKNLEAVTNVISIADPNRFFYLFLHITMRKLIEWAQKDYDATKIYFDSDIECFPDVAIDLGLRLRNRGLSTYSKDGWHAISDKVNP